MNSGENTTNAQELTCTYSGILVKEGKQIVQVRFERNKDYAEGTLPQALILKHQGFSTDEIDQLQQYMAEHQEEIFTHAKEINSFKNLMK